MKLSPFVSIGVVWFSAAFVCGALGVVAELSVPIPQLVLFSLTILLIVSRYIVPPFRRWTDSISWRPILMFHLTRFVGLLFLVYYSKGLLPYDFAVLGGIGDVVIASTALGILLRYRHTPAPPPLLFVWNTMGLADILYVVQMALRNAMEDPHSMAALGWLPLSLLPTFVVPIIIASHLLVFVRLVNRTLTKAA